MGEPVRGNSVNLNNKENKKGHVLLLPYSGQGHINPILQFGRRLASKGLKITFATTVYFSKSMHLKDCKFDVELISDGFDEKGPQSAGSGEIFLSTIREVGSRTLSDLINRSTQACEPITCLVCDSIFPWALDIGKQHGLVTASFYTQPCSVSSIFYHVRQGNLAVPVEDQTTTVSLPGLPQLSFRDLPASVTNPLEPEKTALVMLMDQYSNIENADWLLFNTFDQLESEVLKFAEEEVGRVRAIGPATPSMYLDKGIEGDKEHSLNMFKPSEVDYMKWLNTKQAGSVVYISFGSVAVLGEEQMEQLCWGLKQSNKDFFWVVREKEQEKLPNGFVEEVMEKGLLVPWCSQLEVLAHEAVGCFLTHCGWNSTIEALSLGVPMVAMPRQWDQFTNAKFVQDVWGLGIRVNKDEKGIVRTEELESCIREIMDGERGKDIRSNASRWRELAKEAVDARGSSDLNIGEFVADIIKD